MKLTRSPARIVSNALSSCVNNGTRRTSATTPSRIVTGKPMEAKTTTRTKRLNKKLYDGKFFYEIVRSRHCDNPGCKEVEIKLYGPCDNLVYMNPPAQGFAQIIGGVVVQFFLPSEILVTDHKL
jgi:hypothetical protein